MSESLHVEGFAGLKDIQLQLNAFNLLIGPQATGKSILAKLLFFVKGIVWQLFSAAENRKTKHEFDRQLIKRFEELFPEASWGDKAFRIEYKLDGLLVVITRKSAPKRGISITYSSFLHDELTKLKRYWHTPTQKQSLDEDVDAYQILHAMRRSLIDALGSEYSETASFNQVFVPAGRSFFANLQSSVFSFLSGNNSIDPFLKEFGSSYENVKRLALRSFPGQNRHYLEESDRIIREILCGSYISEKGRDYLDVVDGRRINLGNCSSGQQETLPLALMLKRLANPRGRLSGSSVYVEEPEAHLFPTAQRLILELIALTFNASHARLQVFITTHSPYVLTALNNLLQAGALYKDASDSLAQRLLPVVPQSRAIEIGAVAAYSITREECRSIVNIEDSLLETGLIDEVSNDLSIKFDELIRLHD